MNGIPPLLSSTPKTSAESSEEGNALRSFQYKIHTTLHHDA